MIPNWLEEAELEFEEDAAYYNEKEYGLGDEFIDEIQHTISRILKDPSLPREFNAPYRKLNAKRFPYKVIYVLEKEELYIVAIMNHNRESNYWKNRLNSSSH